jgi:hypothetical protein
MTQKGVTTYQDAEVLAHMDGLVHVDMNGEAVSVDPSQIVIGDAPAAAPSNIFTPIMDTLEKLSAVPPEVMDQINKQMAILETVPGIESRVAALEARVLAMDADIARLDGLIAGLSVQPKPIDAAAPAAQPQPNDESTAPAASAESAGEGQTSGLEATAGATGQ